MQPSPDFGDRIRNARRAAAMSQAELADGIASASYLSLIEAGLRQPSPEVAAALAARLGIPVDPEGRVESDADLVAAQTALHAGDAERAAALAERLPARAPGRLLIEAQLLERRGALLEAVNTLDAALAAVQPGTELWFELTALLCRFALDAGDMSHAIEVGEAAITHGAGASARCEDLLVDIKATLSTVYCETGDLARARRLTDGGSDEQANPRHRASQLWARSIVEHSSGNAEAADQYAMEALRLFRMQDRPLSTARLQVTAATLRMQTPDFDHAEVAALLDDAEQRLRAIGAGVDLAGCLCTQAEFAAATGDARRARTALEEAMLIVQQEGSGIRARIYAAAGDVFAAIGDPAAAHAHLLQARALLEEAGARRSAAATWRHLAATHEALGELDLALACMKAATDLLGLPVRSAAVDAAHVQP